MMVALSAQAPGAVRGTLETRYAATMDRALLDDVKVMASEIVTNAVRHSGRPDGDPLSLSTTVIDGVLHVEVGDEGLSVATLEPRSIDPPSGLGFLEILSDRWSSSRNGSFRVWFEVDVTSRTMLTRAVPV
jgi:anti-sigma regulatory factor (Ser/Thr protein kinase)